MKIPLNTVRADAERIEATRECGPCTACCVLPRISVDEGFPEGKPGYAKCPHLATDGTHGCGIYADRPPVCRDYTCLWRAGIVAGDERRRPDRLGLMFALDGRDNDPSTLVIEVWELWEGAACDNHYMIQGLALLIRVSIRFYGVPASITYEHPAVMLLGQKLSETARVDPPALAAWCLSNISLGRLEIPQGALDAAMSDLDSLRRGEPVVAHYKRNG